MTPRSKRRLAIAASCAVFLAAAGKAAMPDRAATAPAPVGRGGLTSVPLYAVSGVVDAGNIATSFHCTNLGSVAAMVTIAVYEQNGIFDCSMSDSSVEPGGTTTLSTTFTSFYNEDAVCDPAGGTVRGWARIAADSTGSLEIVCTAKVLDGTSLPPAFLENLDLYLVNGTPAGDLIFADGFEFSGTSRWSYVEP